MKHYIGKAVVLGLLVCVSLPVACGDSEKNADPAKGGSGGSGGSGTSKGGSNSRAGESAAAGEPAMVAGAGGGGGFPLGLSDVFKTIECGTKSCDSVGIPLGGLFIDPCCPVGVDDTCGVDTRLLAGSAGPFASTCQPVDQPGEVDEGCPSSAGTTIPAMGIMLPISGFAGCCRADTGTCGVVLDTVSAGKQTLAEFGLGCVDSAPFFAGETAAACGEGAGGGGGASSIGGAGSDTGGAGGTPVQ